VIEPLFLTTSRVMTFEGDRLLTGASGFFFERGTRLFFITSGHVLQDEPSGHRPDRIEIELHIGGVDLTRSSSLSVWLFESGLSQWRQGSDTGGGIDVAAIEINRELLPATAQIRYFTTAHLQLDLGQIRAGQDLLIVGFPLGFHDTMHHLPVVRHAVVASAFGIRFQGAGYFLTDARTHRGMSGAPVVMRDFGGDAALPCRLLGVHSSRIDMGARDGTLDESWA